MILKQNSFDQISSILKNGCNCSCDNIEDELAESLARIDLNDMEKVRVASYESLYSSVSSVSSDSWAEDKTLRVMRRVQGWPQAKDGHWVPHLISLLR